MQPSQLRMQANVLYMRAQVMTHILQTFKQGQPSLEDVASAGHSYLAKHAPTGESIASIWTSKFIHQVHRAACMRPKAAAKKPRLLKKQSKPLLAADMRNNPTKSEAILWDELKTWGAVDLVWRFQVPLHGYIADFYCERLQLVVELDGAFHLNRKPADDLRDRVLLSHGIRTVRIPSSMVFTAKPYVLATIRKAWHEQMHDRGLQYDDIKTYVMHLTDNPSAKTLKQLKGRIQAAKQHIRATADSLYGQMARMSP